MAIVSEQWREHIERIHQRRAAVVVRDAVERYQFDRRPFWELHHCVGTGIQSAEIRAIEKELDKVTNG